MTDFDEQGRPEPQLNADEFETLSGFLEFQRATFAWKCDGLDATGLSATIPSSSMTLGGMMKHLALVEDSWFSERLLGEPRDSAWANSNFDADPDWEWHTASNHSPDDLRAFWTASVERARNSLSIAMADGGLDRPMSQTFADGRSPSVRWIMCHMIEEYARHNGHADILRESIDGATGE
jgi:uncharacterized damage-inducible protein DinB